MFLTFPNKSVHAEVVGERTNQGGGYGLDIPVLHHFYGHKKGVNWIKNWSEATVKNLEKDIKHCLKLFNQINWNIIRSSCILLDCLLLGGSL